MTDSSLTDQSPDFIEMQSSSLVSNATISSGQTEPEPEQGHEQKQEPGTVPEPEPTSGSPTVTAATSTAPKKVFSLFLSPEERKLKMEREAAAAREAMASKAARSASADGSKRGRKVKKVTHNIFAAPSTGVTTSNILATTTAAGSSTVEANGSSKPAITKLSAHVPGIGDPSLAPHPFFDVSREARAMSRTVDNEQCDKFVPRYKWSIGREPPPYPLYHLQYHGPVTMNQLHEVVGEMCDLLAPMPDQCESGRRTHKDFGWYGLRTLGDTSILDGSQEPTSETRIGRMDPKWTTKSGSRRCKRLPQGDLDAPQHHSLRADSFASCKRFTEALVASSGPQLLLAGNEETSPKGQYRAESKFGDLWIDKYRPRSGADVLGNRSSTEYLTQWLKGLEVSAWSLGPDDPHHPSNNNVSNKRSISGIGRPKKRTKRSKARGDDLSDFIVDDDFDDDYYGSDGAEGDEAFTPQANLSPFARYGSEEYSIGEATQSKKLDTNVEIRSNIILLSGPSGSGKTAAVYACAEESGYEIFEVSPGSKRAGRDVLALVGEMAENHHVHVVSSGTGTNSTNNSTPNTPASSTCINGEFSGKRSKDEDTSSPRSTTTDKPSQPSVYNLFFKKFKPKKLEEDTAPEDQGTPAESPAEVSTIKEEEKIEDVQEAPIEEEIEVVEDVPLALHEDTLADFMSLLATTNPRQSLILLEEVDILFDDDKGFWASIATLAAKSKRPIVMTCNDPLLIPPGILKIQEHLKFERPCASELFRYLECICKIEDYVYTPGTLESLIEEGRRDTRRILMQLQLTASTPSKEDSPKDQSMSRPPETTGNRKGAQRLFRITSKGVQSATAPSSVATTQPRSLAAPSKGRPTILTEEQMEEQFSELTRLANNLSLIDASLKMGSKRAFQHFENDQEEPLKDDEQGIRFVFKEPTSDDHLTWDLEMAEIVEDGARAIFNRVLPAGVQRPAPSGIAECACMYTDDMNEHYTQLQGDQSSVYTSALRDMVLADDVNSTIPSGRRSMRSNGGLPRRHLPLYPTECSALSSTAFEK
ncbi:hypothetical protein BGW41_004736 [Actinomortierella wolfii]|nr:hypothetical protein BGW41_004736 [Actinomortierella wolfii]